MKRPKIIRKRYTREAWSRKETACIKALEQWLKSNKAKFHEEFKKTLIGLPFVQRVEIHPKLQSAILRAKLAHEKENSPKNP